jgi:lipoyl-dependent peroxiredoxin
VRGYASGIDEAGFKAAAEAAKAGCPISKALTGVDQITVDVTFEG